MAEIKIDTDQMQEVGNNIQAAQVGNNLVLVINLKAPTFTSSSGKMQMIASSGGFTRIPGNLRANINIGK